MQLNSILIMFRFQSTGTGLDVTESSSLLGDCVVKRTCIVVEQIVTDQNRL